MKKLLLLSALLIFAFGFGQEHKHPVKFKYELTNELSNSKLPYLKGYLSKINNYVVIELEGSQDENYIKVLDYINLNFKNPQNVIVSKLENRYIKINGTAKDLYRQWKAGVTFDFDIRYSIFFQVKENKIKIEINNLEWFDSGIGWRSITNGIVMHKISGKPRKSMLGTTDTRLEDYFNNIANQIKNYKTINSNDDW
jgi:hypothetical protein